MKNRNENSNEKSRLRDEAWYLKALKEFKEQYSKPVDFSRQYFKELHSDINTVKTYNHEYIYTDPNNKYNSFKRYLEEHADEPIRLPHEYSKLVDDLF